VLRVPDFDLARVDGALVLDIAGPPDARPVIEQFFSPVPDAARRPAARGAS
jgi:hypothetical protein